MQLPRFFSTKATVNKLDKFRDRLLKNDNFENAKKLMSISSSKEAEEETLPVINKADEVPYESISTSVLSEMEADSVTLQVGVGLLPLFQQEVEETLEDKIKLMRQELLSKLGVHISPIHVVDHLGLPSSTSYRILIKDCVVAQSELKAGEVLAIKTPETIRAIEGVQTKDPIFNEDALWILESSIEEAKQAGYYVIDNLALLTTHIQEITKRYLHELISRQSVANLLVTLENEHPILLQELEESDIKIAVIQNVLKQLIRDEIPLNKEFPTIIESIVDGFEYYKNKNELVDDLTSYVRQKIARRISESAKSMDGNIHALILEKDFNLSFIKSSSFGEYETNFSLQEEKTLYLTLSSHVKQASEQNIALTLLVPKTEVRSAFARLIHKYNLPIKVLSANELVPEAFVHPFDTLKFNKEKK